QNMRGFNNKPEVVKKNDFDKLMKGGNHIELLRGLRDSGYGKGAVTADKLADDFRNGEHFPGHGIYGSGTYSDSTSGHNNMASSYSGYGTGATLRMALPKTAKIVKISELEKQVPFAPKEFEGYASKGGKANYECWLGVQAALAGYDAIHMDGHSSRHGS